MEVPAVEPVLTEANMNEPTAESVPSNTDEPTAESIWADVNMEDISDRTTIVHYQLLSINLKQSAFNPED